LVAEPAPAVAAPVAPVVPAPVVPEPTPVVSAPVAAAPPAPEPAAAAPAASAAPQPIGPFFEMAQVDKAPRVTARVEPHLPAGSQPKTNDIALVRVLVSQTGHPVLVRMLRPSKGGLAADDAIVEAVKKWTFAPALKKGETVTCWLHVAVPLRAAQ
jgi:periplasmic protein TonB